MIQNTLPTFPVLFEVYHGIRDILFTDCVEPLPVGPAITPFTETVLENSPGATSLAGAEKALRRREVTQRNNDG